MKNFLLDKIEKTFFGKRFIRTDIFGTNCAIFFEWCSLIATKHQKDWKPFLNSFGVMENEQTHLRNIKDRSLDTTIIPYCENLTFFEIFWNELRLLDNKLEEKPLDTYNRNKDIKLPVDGILDAASFWALKGAVFGLVYPEITKKIYTNGLKNNQMIYDISEYSRINVAEKLGTQKLSAYDDKRDNLNLIYADYVFRNCSDEIISNLIL